MFFPKYKRENPSHVLGCSFCCVCEYFVRIRGICLYTYLGLSRRRIRFKNLMIIQLLLDNPRKESVVSEWECLYLLENPRKKESVVSEFTRGRVSKFLLVGSNMMLVV